MLHIIMYTIFSNIYIQKETKTGNYITCCWPLYVILFHAFELWHKRYICTEDQNIILIYFVNLNCLLKLIQKKMKFHHINIINKLEKYKIDRQPFTYIKFVKQCLHCTCCREMQLFRTKLWCFHSENIF